MTKHDAPASRPIESKAHMNSRRLPRFSAPALLAAVILTCGSLVSYSQEGPQPNAADSDESILPDAPQAAQTAPQAPAPANQDSSLNQGKQTKRILFIIPNFRAVSVDEKLPPMTAKERDQAGLARQLRLFVLHLRGHRRGHRPGRSLIRVPSGRGWLWSILLAQHGRRRR
jgi:hypothetical protein